MRPQGHRLMDGQTAMRDAVFSPRSVMRGTMALLVTAIAVWLSVRRLAWTQVGGALVGVRLPSIALAVSLVLATAVLKGIRWQVLLHASGTRAAFGHTLRVLLIGQMGNVLLPARIGDAARAALLSRQALGGIPTVAGTVGAEKALDGLVGILLLLGLAAGTSLPSWVRGLLLGLALLTGALLMLLAVAASQQSQSRRLLEQKQAQPAPGSAFGAKRLLAGLLVGLGLLRQPRRAGAAFFLGAASWLTGGLTNAAVLAALGIQPPAWAAWLALVAVYSAGFLPAGPAQVGVFESACVLALTAAGTVQAEALAFGLLLHMLVLAPTLLLGAASLAIEGIAWSSLTAGHPTQEPP